MLAGSKMQLLILRSPDEPDSLEDGEQVWASGDGADVLPGSLLSVLAPDLDIATWYPFETFAGAIPANTDGIHEVWTTIPLAFSGVSGAVETLIEVKQAQVALVMLKAIVSHVKGLGGPHHLWVYVI